MIAACQTSLSFSVSRSLLTHMSMLVVPSSYLVLCRPFLLLPSIFPNIKVFSNGLVLCIRWPKYRSFSFSISPSDEYSGLISFKMDWFDFLAVQGTLKSLLQHHSSKASVLQHSAFFKVQGGLNEFKSALWSRRKEKFKFFYLFPKAHRLYQKNCLW